VANAIARLLGDSPNKAFGKHLLDLANVGVACAAHFRKTNGQDLPGVVGFEKSADKIVDAIHELLDNAFIMRFDAADALRLTDSLDDVIDGMRGAATHIDIYKRYLRVLRPEAEELIVAGERAIHALRDLVAAVSIGTMTLNRAREGAKAINEAEANADKIIARAERSLVEEFSMTEKNTLEFIALEKLYSMLEQITDDAKRCGKLIVSLIRKEA
jgi:uncharacterized protein Yka (UPF0111/DUF47 family)